MERQDSHLSFQISVVPPIGSLLLSIPCQVRANIKATLPWAALLAGTLGLRGGEGRSIGKA